MSLCYFHVWADFLWTASQWAIWEPSFTHTTGFGGKNRGFACCGSWVQVGVESGLLQRLNKTPHAEYRTVGLMLRRWPFVTCQKNKRTHVYLATANSYGLLLFFNQRWSVFFYVNILSHASLLWRHTATEKYFQNIVLLAWKFQPAQQQLNQWLSDQPTNGREEIYFKYDNSSNKSMGLGVWLYDKPANDRKGKYLRKSV